MRTRQMQSLLSLALTGAALAGAISHAATAQTVSTTAPASPAAVETPAQHDARMAWWRKARFGMFIHWGIYAVPADGEWYMTNHRVPRDQYAQYARQFDPVKFDADRWAQIAHDAGMQYLVITSKHHDGFSMFHTATSTYNVVDATPWRTDPLAALSRACRKHGIHFAVYYSIMDWHSPDQAAAQPDAEHPQYNPTHFLPGRKADYISYMKTELRELITRYHPAILWFDGQWMAGWTDADGQDLYQYLRSLDPTLIINNRVRGAGDYGTPEQEIPATGLPGHDWETCMTINGSWGFNANDERWKSTAQLLHNLIDITSKGGNYLLNVGPTAEGVIPEPEVERLAAMGQWLKVNGEAVYGTTPGPFPALAWGRCTRKGHTLYLHVFDWPKDGVLRVPLKSKVSRAYLLSDRRKALPCSTSGDSLQIQAPAAAPDPIASVVALQVEGEPAVAATTTASR
jgi:alpha-L-fucosidase